MLFTTGAKNCLLSSRSTVRIHQGASVKTKTSTATPSWLATSGRSSSSRVSTKPRGVVTGRRPGRRKWTWRLRLASNRSALIHQLVKRKFRWGMPEMTLYLLSVPIIFILIGLLAALICYLVIAISNTSQGVTVVFYLWMYFMFLFGTSLSLLLSFFVPPIVLRWIRKRRLRRSMRGQS